MITSMFLQTNHYQAQYFTLGFPYMTSPFFIKCVQSKMQKKSHIEFFFKNTRIGKRLSE